MLILVKKQNLENFNLRRKRRGHYKIFSFGAGFALFMEPTQQAAGYSVSQNKGKVEIADIDAYDSSPVLDIKAHMPHCDLLKVVIVSDWAAD